MSRQTTEQLLRCLHSRPGQRTARLPSSIDFDGGPRRLTMTLTASGAGLGPSPLNMQENGAAFEGWAAILYEAYMEPDGEIVLALEPQAVLPPLDAARLFSNPPHYNRFLYRALRFSEQYPWFRLSDPLANAVNTFRQALPAAHLTNNIPSEAEASQGSKLESSIEYQLADRQPDLLRGLLKTAGLQAENCPVFRQLPVGLFAGQVSTKTAVFTHGASAIDLWALCGDTLAVIELKANNKMVGSLTELFFYTNYAYDLFLNPASPFKKNPQPGKRGYPLLLHPPQPLTSAAGFLLLDEDSVHPLVTEAVLRLLSHPQQRPGISYGMLSYHLTPVISAG